MDSEDLPAQIRSMSISQLIQGLKNIRTKVQADEELTRRQRGHLVQLLMLLEKTNEKSLSSLDTMIGLVSTLKTENELFKHALLMDMHEYPTLTPEDKRKLKDRIYKYLAGDTPKDIKKDDLEKIEVSGHEFEQPDRFK